MSSRRKHTKSRHGCAQCKAAHTKCDIAQPTCGKCMKTGKSCEFQNLVGARFLNTLSVSYGQGHPTNSPPLVTTPSDTTAIAIAPENNVFWDELELMHQFSTVTYATMASRDDLRRMWQIQVPRMALKKKYLMHSLFSVTALHMARSHPENQSSYIDRAIRHHNIALQEFSLNLQSITQENITSLFTCATLTVIFALSLAISRPHEEPTGPIEELLDIFMLLRGVPLFLGEMWDWVRESEIAPLFAGRESDDSIVLSDDVIDAIKLLKDRNQLMSRSDSERHTYTLAIQGLEECFKLISSKDRDNGMVLSWPISVSQEYIAFLRSRQQMALVILAHYAVILDEIRDAWWAMGWGSKLIQELHQVVEDDWKSLLVWPMDKIVIGR
ncbi:hypothetical protein V502_03422 [Pseudogymnoascus sp. VKM F-4520 (FW-2644)]|nr:hypothetical protein V502_03422 [Pseudogymnoascus sp. VKM F-4520 (FW-2644)]